MPLYHVHTPLGVSRFFDDTLINGQPKGKTPENRMRLSAGFPLRGALLPAVHSVPSLLGSSSVEAGPFLLDAATAVEGKRGALLAKLVQTI